MFWCSKRLERGCRVLEWETLHFCCRHLRGKKRMCKFSLYMEIKTSIMLKNFDTKEEEDFLWSLLDPKSNTWEDFWKIYGRLRFRHET